jgi:hypothetical protein
VPLPDEFFGEIGDDALRSAIEARGAAFVERSDLGDFHGTSYVGEVSIGSCAIKGSRLCLSWINPKRWCGLATQLPARLIPISSGCDHVVAYRPRIDTDIDTTFLI